MNNQDFKVGQQVRWSSQAGGSTRAKVGRVIMVVPAGVGGAEKANAFIRERELAKTHRSAFGFGWDRPEQSYVVEVAGQGPKARPVLYWPRTASLQPAP